MRDEFSLLVIGASPITIILRKRVRKARPAFDNADLLRHNIGILFPSLSKYINYILRLRSFRFVFHCGRCLSEQRIGLLSKTYLPYMMHNSLSNFLSVFLWRPTFLKRSTVVTTSTSGKGNAYIYTYRVSKKSP